MFLIDDLLVLPLKGFVYIVEKIRDMAEDELYDEDKVKEEILELQMRYEMGEISEKEYGEVEAKLIQRLEQIQEYRRNK
jgi:uncharacterized membrane protein